MIHNHQPPSSCSSSSSSSSSSPPALAGLRKQSASTLSHRSSLAASLELSGHRPPIPIPITSPIIPNPSPVLLAAEPPATNRLRSNTPSSSSSSSHTPPGTWSVSGKLVRKKASGLFREAARSWGRSKSKEVLSFGLGVLIGNSESTTQNPSQLTQPIEPPPPPPPPPLKPPPSPHPQTTPTPVAIVIKGPKKRISFHGPRKLKGKSIENSKLLKRRSEIGFGDWADTLNTAVASSSPQPPQPLPSQPSSHTPHSSATTHPSHPSPTLNHANSSSHLSTHPSDPMTLSLRRRDRSFNLAHNPTGPPPVEAESFSSAPSSRVPRSTFPHAHRSPRSPRRFYNTRSAVQRNQSCLHPPSVAFLLPQTSTPHAHTPPIAPAQYQQPAPLTSSPFKRSVSPNNQFDDDFDLESPIASKSHGRASQAPELQLRAASSARANLFGAMPNRSGGLEPSSSYGSFSNSSTPQAAQPSHPLPLWTHETPAHPSNPTPTVLRSTGLRSRQRTVSATLQEHSSRLQAQYLTTLLENGCDLDPEVTKSGFGSPSSSPSHSPIQAFAHNPPPSSASHKTSSYQNHRAPQAERWAMPRIEGLGMTPRRPSLDGSCDDSDPDDKATRAGSSKPSSTTSILSFLTTQDLTDGPFKSSLKTTLGGFDAFGALPPPESPFPGPPRIKRAGPSTSPASPNKLKRDVDGELVGFASQPNLYRHRAIAQAPTCSMPSLRLKNNPFELIHPSQRDSWGRQWNSASDEDEDEAGVTDQHDRDAINGSHESHEGTSNLSVPALTDSSSLASSLASSNQSSDTHNVRPAANGAALLSSTWDESSRETGRETKRRSLPTHVGRTSAQLFAPVPPLPIGLVPPPPSGKHYLLPPPAPLIRSTESSFQENESSFQNVKPNASAFLSSGMKSKIAVARDRREQSFGSSGPLIQYSLMTVSDPNVSLADISRSISTEPPSTEKSLAEIQTNLIAVQTLCQALGGPHKIVAAVREDEAHQQSSVEHHDQSLSLYSTSHVHSPCDSSLGIILPESLRKPSVSSLKMPDTPMKRPFSVHKTHPHINKPLIPSGLSKQSHAYSPSLNGSPADNSPSSRCHQLLVPESPIPNLKPEFKSNPRSLVSAMTPEISNASPQFPVQDDIDPSPSLNRSTMIGQIPLSFDSLSKHSPVFRRRSSDAVLSSHGGGSSLNKNTVSQQSNPFDEAGTPTKVPSGWLKRAPQLLTSPSPGNSRSSVANSPSMHHHLQVDQLRSGNSSLEHLAYPQITPNRTGTRTYPSFVASPITDADFRPGSSASLTPGPDYSASSSSRPLPLANRYASPTTKDNQPTRNVSLCSSSSDGRFENQFDVIEIVGSGEFGEVYQSRRRLTGKVSAIKRAKKTANGPKALGKQYEEVDILKRLTEASTPSQYIIDFFDAWEQFNRWYMDTEFCGNGTLERFLELIAGLQDGVDEGRIWKITSELAQAIAFLHSHGVLHLDIKPANIFITAFGGLKVGDFGLARRWPRISPNDVRECGLLNGRHKLYQHVPTNSSNPEADSLVPSRFLRYEDVSDNEERHMMRFKNCGRFVGFDLEREGDREYIAPEILSGRYGEEADVFSVGLIALEISTNVVLPDNGDEWRALRSSDFSRTDLSHLSSELVLLIKRMMDKCPDRRITAAELVQHPVLAKMHGLRGVGLEAELKVMTEIQRVSDEEKEQRQERLDNGGDIHMFREDLIKEPIENPCPPPLPNNVWRAARGAILQEVEGFLPFILTGQGTPSRTKAPTRPAIIVPMDDCRRSHQEVLSKAKVIDAMEIDV